MATRRTTVVEADGRRRADPDEARTSTRKRSYDRAAPGVVTVPSVFDDGGAEDVTKSSIFAGGARLRWQAAGGPGFRLRHLGRGRDRHQRARRDRRQAATGQTDATRSTRPEVFVQFPDRNSVEAEMVGFDPFADIALIKVDPEGLDLQPVELGNIEDIEVGEQVAAIGSPFGERQSLSVGFVSALDRSIPSLTSFQIDGAIQTDASINPGNSGGPLLDSEAQVIGINQQIDTTSGGNQGVGFAVPVDLSERSVEQLREDGKVEYAYIGVAHQAALSPARRESWSVDADAGAIVADVEPDSPAEEAGHRGRRPRRSTSRQFRTTVGGDIIVSVDGEAIETEADLPRIVSRLEPGEEVTLGVIRDGDEEEVTSPSGRARSSGT